MSHPSQLAPGDVFDGRYVIEGPLGKGGWSFVYRAHDRERDRPCALKLLDGEKVEDDEILDRFLAEAKVLATLAGHPHVVECFGSGFAEGEVAYVATELVEGTTLTKFMKDHAPVAWTVASRLIREVASALDHAHAHGIIHRDLKPGNVLVTGEGENATAKLLDFGIAKMVEQIMGGSVTRIGTPVYCAPEQLGSSMREVAAKRGVTIADHVSPATDVWPLGLLAFELLTGYKAKTYWGSRDLAQIMIRATIEDRTPPSKRAGARSHMLPPDFDDWFLRCIERDAADRWPSAGEAATALSAMLELDDEDVPTLVAGALDRASSTAIDILNAKIAQDARAPTAAAPEPPTPPKPTPSTPPARPPLHTPGPDLWALVEKEKKQQRMFTIGAAVIGLALLVVAIVALSTAEDEKASTLRFYMPVPSAAPSHAPPSP